MLAAVVPTAQMPAPWLLGGVPALSWAVAALCWWRLRALSVGQAFVLLREQIGLDADLLHEVQTP